METFNLLNTFNWAPPTLMNADRTHTNFNSGAFGRISAPRSQVPSLREIVSASSAPSARSGTADPLSTHPPIPNASS